MGGHEFVWQYFSRDAEYFSPGTGWHNAEELSYNFARLFAGPREFDDGPLRGTSGNDSAGLSYSDD
jgi:hypothetical protein